MKEWSNRSLGFKFAHWTACQSRLFEQVPEFGMETLWGRDGIVVFVFFSESGIGAQHGGRNG